MILYFERGFFMIYGYARISTKRQSLQRQIDNLKKYNSSIEIYQEVYTGTEIEERVIYKRLKKKLKMGDILVFDSVSRMSRNANEGIKEYFELMNQGITLVFLKERYIDTTIYQEQLEKNDNIRVDDIDLDDTIVKGIREYLKRIAIKQIKIAFDQSEKEVQDLRTRTKEALKIKKEEGSILGRRLGTKIETKKSKEMKEKIKLLAKDFKGTLKDIQVIEVLKISRNTYFKYKRELRGLNKGE